MRIKGDPYSGGYELLLESQSDFWFFLNCIRTDKLPEFSTVVFKGEPVKDVVPGDPTYRMLFTTEQK